MAAWVTEKARLAAAVDSEPCPPYLPALLVVV